MGMAASLSFNQMKVQTAKKVRRSKNGSLSAGRIRTVRPSIVRHADEQFDVLADQWERETRNISSLSDLASHPAYQKIIAMGACAVPKILRRIKSRPGFWFEALRQLTRDIEPVDPVRPSMYGDLQKMTNAWLKWGAAHGQIANASKV
jgi:hypothetical protein